MKETDDCNHVWESLGTRDTSEKIQTHILTPNGLKKLEVDKCTSYEYSRKCRKCCRKETYNACDMLLEVIYERFI